jgi:hypothetical protein
MPRRLVLMLTLSFVASVLRVTYNPLLGTATVERLK